jgi:hypothetical protein
MARPASPWPRHARCAVMLTLDFDAEAGWLSRDPDVARRPGILLSRSEARASTA